MEKVPPKPRRNALSDVKLVALGVAAEIIVVFENKDACIVSRGFLVEVRCRQSADAATNDDQIVSLSGIFGLARRVPERAIAQGVSGVE